MDHLLSIKSAAVTRVAGHANAEIIPLNTVCIAPSLINSIATPAVIGFYLFLKIMRGKNSYIMCVNHEPYLMPENPVLLYSRQQYG